jgi:hypothetical protein
VTNTSTSCTPPGVPEWTNTNPGNRANLTGGVGPFAIADSDRCGSGSTLDTIMTTPACWTSPALISPTGVLPHRLQRHRHWRRPGVAGGLSTDGGATWTNGSSPGTRTTAARCW